MAKKNFGKLNFDLNKVRDALTDTISTVADKVLDLADGVADTAKTGQQLAKLYVEKKKEETALENAYKELGKLYYDLHKEEAEGVIADLCAEIENTLVNLEDINSEIEALKDADDAEIEIEIPEDEGDAEEAEEDGFLEQMADSLEDAFEGLEEAIEGALEKLESIVEGGDCGEVEVEVTEYLDDDDFVAPQQDNDVEVEIIEVAFEGDGPPAE